MSCVKPDVAIVVIVENTCTAHGLEVHERLRVALQATLKQVLAAWQQERAAADANDSEAKVH